MSEAADNRARTWRHSGWALMALGPLPILAVALLIPETSSDVESALFFVGGGSLVLGGLMVAASYRRRDELPLYNNPGMSEQKRFRDAWPFRRLAGAVALAVAAGYLWWHYLMNDYTALLKQCVIVTLLVCWVWLNLIRDWRRLSR